MDPALQELSEAGRRDDEVEVIVRLAQETAQPRDLRIVSRFGRVATARITRGNIRSTWEDEAVISLKASRPFSGAPPETFEDGLLDEDLDEGFGEGLESGWSGPARVPGIDGSGVVVGILDWGVDPVHPNIRHPDGRTRLLGLWDQGGARHPRLTPRRFGYGRAFSRADIDAALQSADPYATLGYHPSKSDPGGMGTHGMHVCDIAAGNRRARRSVTGVASGADIVAVHLSAGATGGLQNFGDSTRLLEALDWVTEVAGDRPLVVNVSAGKTGGPHNGATPVEQALDAWLTERPGRALCQSAGNYAAANLHAEGRIGPGRERVLRWKVNRGDRTTNELEVWYAGSDRFDVLLIAPDGGRFRARLGDKAEVLVGGKKVGTLYHRRREPNTGQNHVDIFLYASAPAGTWSLRLRGDEVVDGRFHAWIERDAGGRHQSRFVSADASPHYTTNTIANSQLGIAVGAYDPHNRDVSIGHFSSGGPTVDGRQKPELLAPGVRIRAARSASGDGLGSGKALTVKSGTSMAAPHVAGSVALLFQAAGRPLRIQETRSLLLGSLRPVQVPDEPAARQGYGLLDIEALVKAGQRFAARGALPGLEEESEESTHEAEPEHLIGEDTPRPRLSVWATETLFPTASGQLLPLTDPRYAERLAARLQPLRGVLDDITLKQTLTIGPAGRDGAYPCVWDTQFLPPLTRAADRIEAFRRLLTQAHSLGMRVLAGYGEVTPGSTRSTRGDLLVRLLGGPVEGLDRHADAIAARLREVGSGAAGFDGLSFDLEVNGLNARHRDKLRGLFERVHTRLRADNADATLAFACAGYVSSTRTYAGPIQPGWMDAHPFSLAAGLPGAVARPMVYDGPRPTAAHLQAIVDHALAPLPGGGGLTPNQLQIGLKVVPPGLGVFTQSADIEALARDALASRGVGLIFWYLRPALADHARELSGIRRALG
jgi:subtilisin family serine protease